MEDQFDFSDITITEADITDEMVRKECISYLIDKASKSKYLKESITIVESEKFIKWISSLSIDEAVGLIFEESSADIKYAARKKAITQGIERAKRILQRKEELKKSGAKYANWVKAKKEAEGSWTGKSKTYSKLGKKWFRLSTGKKAAIIGGGAVAAIGLGLAARALYNKYLSKCARQCKDSADKASCMAKCKAAAKAAAQKSKGK